uniref:PGG domain-containing protein n=1 Tax=Aegilops tauschii subsp. strangulata TaxID=200361 RepID=A0A453ACA3_AEGTS
MQSEVVVGSCIPTGKKTFGDLPASKIMQHIPSPPRPPQANQMATPNIDSISDTKLYELKEQLLLLTTLVATVTYVTGLNLPGGAWQTQQADGHGPLAGDPILRDIHYRRYLAFYYCNGTALASSVVVCLILVMLRRDSPAWSVVLRVVMVLDLLGLMGSYAAGTCHDTFATIWVVALAFPVLAYITYAFVCYLCLPLRRDNHTPRNTNTGYQEKEKIEVLMLLATFAVTISYAAGLNPPGGFWTSTGHKDGRLLHLAGDPIMEDSALRRYRAFFVCNTTAFVASLLIILLLLDKNLSRTISARFVAVYGFIGVALLGLMGAYAAGSCRETDNTIKVLSLAAGVPICVILQLALNYVFYWPIKNMCDSFTRWLQNLSPRGILSLSESLMEKNINIYGASALADPDLKNTRFFVMVLASFAVSITYQAGLDPPGGLWKDDLNGHKIGHPVLRTTHPARYQVFFYSNSAAFVTSLVVVMMVQSKFLLKRRTLVAAMVLDLIGLVIAYAAGSTRDASTSIYVVAVACLVLSYVVVHIALGGEKENVAAEPAPAAGTLDDKRQVLLLIAILAAALTYQAGLTPPGGFWQKDDEVHGHRAGYPVLLDNYPRRYKAFFYCNAASFMASVALILLLVNRKLYRPGIRCYALHVCMAVGMFALMGAYAAGSSRHLKTSIYVLTLVIAVSASIPLQVAMFWYIRNYRRNHQHDEGRIRRRRTRGLDSPDQEKDEELEYLMLLGVLVASVTYQSGLRPPGGLWEEGNAAGNPILHDVNKRRYDIFLYSNSTSFMASGMAIVMLRNRKWPLWPVHTAILLDMLGLLVAYAAGSTRTWKSSRNVIFILLPVLAYIALYAAIVAIYIYICNKNRTSSQLP